MLDQFPQTQALRLQRLEQLAPHVFVCEMLVRLWGTLLAARDYRRGTDDLTVLSRNVVGGFLQVRHRLMSELTCFSESEFQRVSTLDKLRCKCDRWTDTLIGKLAVEQVCFEFSFDPERALDFAEKSFEETPFSAHAVGHLFAEGLRMNFLQLLPAEQINEPEIANLMQSILSNVTSTSFRSDTALLQLRLTAVQHRFDNDH